MSHSSIVSLLKLTTTDTRLDSIHIAVYVAILTEWSKNNFSESFAVVKHDIMKKAHITRAPTYSQTIKELFDFGYIDYNSFLQTASIIKQVNIKTMSFKESSIYSFENFEKALSQKGYSNVDLKHYYSKIKEWADEKEPLSSNWINVARKFIVEDRLNGKLKTLK